jgi:branched-chain amino acid transport system permease protein
LLGLGTGAIYAALGLGLVVTYRASGVVNFAFGAMAMATAYVFAELRNTGDLVLPFPGIPIPHVGDEVSFIGALAISLAFCIGLSLLAYVLVFRPLRGAPPLATVVASVGITLALQAGVVLRFAVGARPVAPILPNEPVELLGITIPRDRLFLALLVIGAAVLLWAGLRFTRFGLATRAGAEDDLALILVGRSRAVLAATNWALAGLLAGLAGILLAPITSLDPLTYTLLVIPALGAALLGRFTSLGITVAGGLGLGMAQSFIAKLQADLPWLPRVGLREGIPFVVIIVVTALGGQVLPGRGALVQRRLPPAPRPRRVLPGAGVLAGTGVLGLVVLRGPLQVSLVNSMVGALICCSLVVLTGYVGQISLGQMAFAGVAGFGTSYLADDWGIPFPLAPILAALLAGAVGVLVGIPALRVRGVNLAVVTMAAAVAIDNFVFRNPDITGGLEGAQIPKPRLFGLDLSIGSGGTYPRIEFGFVALVALVGVVVLVANLRRGETGQRMLAVRANERAAAAAGINVARTKLLAFGISAAIAGLAGSLIAYQQTRVSFASFGVFVSLAYVAYAYLGGITTVSGAVIGGLLVSNGLVFTALDRWVSFGEYELLTSGLALVTAAVLWPAGIAGAIDYGVQRWRRSSSTSSEAVVDDLAA